MKCMTKYVALDVHQATTVASVRGESGRVLARTILPTEEPALVEFFGGMRGAVRVTFEVGTQSQWLYELVAPLVDRVPLLSGSRFSPIAPARTWNCSSHVCSSTRAAGALDRWSGERLDVRQAGRARVEAAFLRDALVGSLLRLSREIFPGVQPEY
jgi:hypothetical protein